ncbi:MAG: asparagine synthase (glutamine-hydrolyzing) [Vicinamibacterales bacterium]
MCGIVGIVDLTAPPEDILQRLDGMANVILHRGPDDKGLMADHGCGLGMRRLSIIDVAGGQQPIANETGDVHVVCNGEIYNFPELRRDLTSRGHHFHSGSDVEVIVHLYEEHGEHCVQFLRGMFALALWDSRKRRLLIARDRLGKKPLFYAQRGDRFWFGSEMKSLLVDEPSLREANYRVLGSFFQFGYISEPSTIYAHIQRLPAGHFGVLEDGRFRSAPYWTLRFEADEGPSEEEWIERLDAKLAEVVRIRLQSEVPLGVFLSGGLDSSTVLAYAARAGLKPLKTFTIGFDRPEWDESEDAQRIANHFQSDHHILRICESDLSNAFASTLDAIVRHCDEPFGDASAIPTFHLSRLAREHVTVILSGDGGDELFAGYSSYRGALFAERYRRLLPHVIGRHVLPALAQAGSRLLRGRRRFQAQRVAKVLRDSALPIAEAYRDKTSTWSVAALQSLFTDDLLHSVDYLGDQYMPDHLWGILHSNRDLVSRLTEIDIRSYMLDDILVKVDRMSMAHSLEVRCPLLDHELVELAATMPTRMKIRDGRGKYVLRRVLAKALPARSLVKRKQGFSVPLRDWFRGPLRDLVHDTLTSADALPPELFSMPAVRRTLDEHQRGVVDHGNRIWLLLTFAAWHGRYQAGAPASLRRDVPIEARHGG